MPGQESELSGPPLQGMPGFLSPGKGAPLLLIPEYSGINKGQRVPDRSKTAHRKPLIKCFLTHFDELLCKRKHLSLSQNFYTSKACIFLSFCPLGWLRNARTHWARPGPVIHLKNTEHINSLGFSTWPLKNIISYLIS